MQERFDKIYSFLSRKDENSLKDKSNIYQQEDLLPYEVIIRLMVDSLRDSERDLLFKSVEYGLCSSKCKLGYSDMKDCPSCCDVFELEVDDKKAQYSIECLLEEDTQERIIKSLFDTTFSFIILSISFDKERDSSSYVKIYSVSYDGAAFDVTGDFSYFLIQDPEKDGIYLISQDPEPKSRSSFRKGTCYISCPTEGALQTLIDRVRSKFPTVPVSSLGFSM